MNIFMYKTHLLWDYLSLWGKMDSHLSLGKCFVNIKSSWSNKGSRIRKYRINHVEDLSDSEISPAFQEPLYMTCAP